ncbi:MAG TPA: serine/threonine protein kinase [Planctomycetes bacterium]|nr:serine/threonine protein kinase [Planctomycetota bacterium]
MATKEEMLLGRLAVLHGEMSQGELDECLGLQARSQEPLPLDKIILDRGYLSARQLQHLRELARKDLTVKRHRELPQGAERFGRLAIAKGWITPDQLAECLTLQRRMQEHNLYPNIGDILVEKSYLSQEQVKELLREQGKTLLKCPACGAKYNVASYDPAKHFVTCKGCGAPLEPAGKLVTTTADDQIVQPPAAQPRKVKARTTVMTRVIREGDVIGGYRVEKLIGQGGMSKIYLAQQVSLERPVAVKILPPYLAEEAKLINRFLKEARALAALDHPNIVQILDLGRARSQFYMAMQYIKGETVSEILAKRGKFEPVEAARVVKNVASALAYAHERDILHRDIKPGNIMVTQDGFVKLLDFGLTKSIQSTTNLTTEGMVIGTVHYMSPEQAAGEKLDLRSDLYSLGTTWYEMVAGRPPFEGDNPWSILLKHRNEPAENVRVHNRRVPRKMAKIIMKLLEKDKNRRYYSGADLVQAIERAGY